VPEVFALGSSQISVSDGKQLSGITQGSGVHLQDAFITLNSNAWEGVDISDDDANFADSDGSQTLTTAQTFDTVSYTAGRVVEAEYSLTLRAPDGMEYTVYGFNIREPGAPNPYGTVEGLAFFGGVGGFPPIGVALEVIATNEGPSTAYTTLATPTCFTRGGRIQTPSGERLVEQLCIGDWVETLDHGPQRIKWIGCTRLPEAVLCLKDHFRPIVVKKDAFGEGTPKCEMRLSPQHRVLLEGWQAELYFGEADILVPIKKLVNDISIVTDRSDSDVEYYHIEFSQHELVWCDGLVCESYLPDQIEADADVDIWAVRNETLALMPDMPDRKASSLAARVCVADKRAAVLAHMLL
jgi:hypothetical protein